MVAVETPSSSLRSSTRTAWRDLTICLTRSRRSGAKAEREGTQEYHGACLGLVLIRRWVLEKLQITYDPQESFWFEWRGRNSQDVNFYARTHFEAKARTGVDRDNDIIHIGKKKWTMKEYWETMDAELRKQEV